MGTTDDFRTSFLHFFLFSISDVVFPPLFLSSLSLHLAKWFWPGLMNGRHVHTTSVCIWHLASSRPVHSLILSSHLFFCLPCLLPPFTVPSTMVLARPDEQTSLHLFMMVRSSLDLIACWILAWTSSLVTWFLFEMHSILG